MVSPMLALDQSRQLGLVLTSKADLLEDLKACLDGMVLHLGHPLVVHQSMVEPSLEEV